MPNIGGVNINWDEAKPAGGDSISIGDNQARSDKSAIRSALAAEHNFDAAGGANTGYHVPGSARPYFGAQSAVSSTGTDGRLYHASDSSRFFGVGSGGTTFIGGPTVISAGSYPGTVPQRAIWVEEFGEGKTISGTTIVSIPNSGYSGKPYVQLTAYDQAGSVAQIMYLTSVTATQFTVKSSATNLLGASSTSFFWRSIGSRTL